MGFCQYASIFVLFIIAIIIFYIISLNRKFKYWKIVGIPSPIDSIWSMITVTCQMIKKPIQEYQIDGYKKYGRVYGLFMGTQPQLSVAEPHLLKQILVKDFNMFHNRMKMKSGEPLLDKMLSALEDEDWKRIRCIMSPTFSSGRMRKMTYLVKECAEKFINHCEKLADMNKPIECKKYFSSYSLDVIASTAFGTKLDSLNDPENEFVINARKLSNSDMSFLIILIFLIPGAMKLFRLDFMTRDILRYFKNFAQHAIDQRDKQKIRANDFLQLMVDAQRGMLETSSDDSKEENEHDHIQVLPKHKTMTMNELFAQCILFLFAGSETTTNTLIFLIYYLALYPECQTKLVQEVDTAWKENDDITFDVINKMQYLDCVVNETLRIQPIAMQLARECTEDYNLDDAGIHISKGTSIVVPVYAMHHDPEFFPNPETFDPERFSPENRSSIPQYVYLPFGDGPRNCIGMRFATMILKMCVVKFFKKFNVLATEETKKPLEFCVGQTILQPKTIVVKLERRK